MENTMIGEYVVVRSSPSGCWAGKLVRRTGSEVELSEARRLWRWWAAAGVSLSGVAATWLDKSRRDEIRVAPAVATAVIMDCCEILKVAPDAADEIAAWEVSRG